MTTVLKSSDVAAEARARLQALAAQPSADAYDIALALFEAAAVLVRLSPLAQRQRLAVALRDLAVACERESGARMQ